MKKDKRRIGTWDSQGNFKPAGLWIRFWMLIGFIKKPVK